MNVLGFGRRLFLLGSAAFLVAPASMVSPSPAHESKAALSNSEEWVARGLGEVFGDLDGLGDIGQRYLTNHAIKTDQATLISKLFGTDAPCNSQDMQRRIAGRRDRDFRNDEIILVDGWILARTEADLCALVFLLANGQKAA